VPFDAFEARDRLALLASARHQRHYLLGATSEDWPLPEEMLENALAGLERVLDDQAAAAALTAAERTAFAAAREALLGLLESFPLDASVSTADLIERDPTWAAMRDAARSCLVELGFSLEAWEDLEIR
jgi:hypothetical protein